MFEYSKYFYELTISQIQINDELYERPIVGLVNISRDFPMQMHDWQLSVLPTVLLANKSGNISPHHTNTALIQ